jgi:L-ascorbate metabolism protein UlaG (beta-lactamase superfamily)
VSASIEDLKGYAEEHLRWYGQSAFRLSAASGEVLFMDPFRVPASAGPADIILISHPHSDHFDRRAVSSLRGSRTEVVVPQSSARAGLEGISAGQSLRIGNIGITALPAYNLSKPFHARQKGWVGYVVEVDGLRVYHAGDTDLIPEMKGLKPDIALLPVGGLFTMNAAGAAEAAGALGAVLAIPMHFNGLFGGRDAGERFARLLGVAAMVLKRSS